MEDPAQGTQAIYQLISDEKYETFENCIFMPPYPYSSIAYSGNYLALLAGMAPLLFLDYSIELATKRLLNNLMKSAAIDIAIEYLIMRTNPSS
ncbi:hypothetical protein D3C75_953530 [compost metagenome]